MKRQVQANVLAAHRPLVRQIAAILGTLLVYASPSWAQRCTPLQLIAPNGAAGDRAGISVAISGDTLLVGADQYGGGGRGLASVYRRTGTGWAFEATLVASDGRPSDLFGWSVAIEGDTAIAGAHRADVGGNGDQGAAYVFVRTGTIWTQQAKLTASDGAPADNFGHWVSLSGNTLVISSEMDDVGANTDQGSAYVFVRSGTTWTQQAKLTASGGGAGDRFASSVSLTGDTVVVGAFTADVGGNTDQGAAYVFTRAGTVWTQQATLTASPGAPYSYFGSSVAISGETALVGAFHDTVGGNPDQGAAYAFVRSETTWAQQARLTSSDGAPNDQYGYSVALDGDTALAGALLHDAQRGAAYVYVRSGSAWTQQAQLTALDGDPFDRLGLSVALSGDTAVAGVYQDTVGENYLQGSAWVFPNLSGVDVDGDGLGDLCDPCPGDATNTCVRDGSIARFISAATGGTLRTPNGEVTLEVPAGALDMNRTLSITQTVLVDPTTDLYVGGRPGRGVAVAVYNFEPDGATFSPAASLHFVLDVGNLNAGQRGKLAVYQVDVNGVFFPLSGALVGVTTVPPFIATIEVPLEHFSDFAVIAPLDSDNDGLFDLFAPDDEWAFGTDPLDPDTDRDGLLDGTEVDMAMGTGCPSPTAADSDGDHLSDGAEVARGTNVCNADTDGDGIPDNLDPFPLDPGGTRGYIERELRNLAVYISGVDLALFTGPNANANRGRRNALSNKANAAANAIAHGHAPDAIGALTNLHGFVDGLEAPPDWLIECPARQEIERRAADLIVLLGYL